MAVLSRSLTTHHTKLLLALAWASASCGDQDDLEGIEGEKAPASGGQPGGDPSGGASNAGGSDTGRQPAAGSRSVGKQLPLEACATPLVPAAAATCRVPDVVDALGGATPHIDAGNTCADAQAHLVSDRPDLFSFSTAKSDPVAVTYAYSAVGSADLTMLVRGGPNGYILGNVDQPRTGPIEQARVELAAIGGATYTVEVGARAAPSCQPYTLRVDGSFCTDALEDNDTPESATVVAWNAQAQATYEANAHHLDVDHYRIASAKADPILVKLAYTAAANDTTNINFVVRNSDGYIAINDDAPRAGVSELREHWLAAPAIGTTYSLALEASAGLCTPYKLSFDNAACTDLFEDNDSNATAKPLAPNTEASATIIASDLDVYDVSALTRGGSCVVTYTIDGARPQLLGGKLLSFAGDLRGLVDSTGSGATQTLTYSWEANAGVRFLELGARDLTCQPYTIRCTEK